MTDIDKSLLNVSFTFKEVCKVAKYIKPDCWCIIASDQRLAFVEINLPHTGPATLQKQLILNNYLQVEAYVGVNRIREEVLTTDVRSVVELENCLRAFARFGTCLGNRNFHRSSQTNSQSKIEYWKHTNCSSLYVKDNWQKERCCDACLTLNSFLTKKQREHVIPCFDDFSRKKVKTETTDDIDVKEVV